MFSGVAGMKAHQTKMDVIGNNIANVNTYGYKSQRALFSDIYYQTLRSGSAGTANRGGISPSSVGYGSTLSGTQVQMSQSSMQNTGFGLDVAITGEGFLQVMDADGNIFYTKAGMLDYDSNGYLTDINGNFVLGAATADGDPSSQKIRLTNVGAVPAQRPSVTQAINGVDYTITASNSDKAGNVSITMTSSEALPAGQDVLASISNTGAITLTFNAFSKFTDWNQLNDAINKAITEANNGVKHKAGDFTISSSNPDLLINGGAGLTGAQLVGANFGTDLGTVTGMDDGVFGAAGMIVEKVSTDFSGSGDTKFSATFDQASSTWTIKATVNGKEYVGQLGKDTLSSSILLKNGDEYIQVSNPGYDKFNSAFAASGEAGASNPPQDKANWTNGNKAPDGSTVTATFTPSTPSKDLGFGSYPFVLQGGTAGGAVTLDELNVAIGTDGSVVVSNSAIGDVTVGRISLANFANPAALAAAGNNYFTVSANSGEPQLADPGQDGTGALKSSALEMSNVDLSSEFADMITTQRGFQANSRIITVSDTMLEELINLKR
ncbi:MAG TPA: flagellar hook-basal body complex protein [Candidatus Ruthenibacterium avium]|uniref:Flagellar hook protein FlgE n=1 Tax=Candidatus Ruthenibacterium avium TaxID=2838751 RepID=A0A9D2M2C2_9FIRM|nr:flagellar hook-basal body complex protein [Candidatus Ruthenibacterium avium]